MYVLSDLASAGGHLAHQEEMPITQYLPETVLLTLQSLTVRPFLRRYAPDFVIVDDLREKVRLCDPIALTVRDRFAEITVGMEQSQRGLVLSGEAQKSGQTHQGRRSRDELLQSLP